MQLGQLRLLFIQEELLDSSIMPFLQTIMNDHDISPRLFLVLVEGDLNAYLSNKANQKDFDYKLWRMFKHYEQDNDGSLTVQNIHQFLKRMYGSGIDPVLPTFSASADSLTYNGTALFKHDRYVDIASDEDDQIFQMLDHSSFLRAITIPELKVALGNVTTNVDISFSDDFSKASFHTVLKGWISEYRGKKDIMNEHDLNKLTEEIEGYLKKRTESFLAQLQEKRVYPFKDGPNRFRFLHASVDEKRWEESWPAMDIDVQYQVHFVDRG
ncbi:spore gernimation protein [Bacillaceae bacterium SIJ1]|uniref:Ger(x)C family spore germination protein n=1 Tax=Litoribacterium kuwaitense TaxID=1398745 RepID=UPI0013EBA4B4|nr:Ger(x)C family spore germination C-terminal domain-containing protein [Litoribacterium kuwaitense]NGP46126.1 spore gernimation protein [Litoribacterium kuwaitense]